MLAAAAAVAAAFCLVAGVPAASASTVVQTIPVGGYPWAVSSDGTHVWVAGNNGVTELDASTGAVVQTIPVGYDATGISSDGTHVWVMGTWVTELDASTGAVAQTISFGGGSPTGISSDGTHVWIADYVSDDVIERDASTGAFVQSIPADGGEPEGVFSDGTHVWVSDSGNTVTELDASTGAFVQTIPIAGGVGEVSSDGTHVWVTGNNGVTELDASTGAVVLTIPIADGAAGVSSDGTHVWVTGNNTVTELDASTGAVVQTIPVGTNPAGVSSDGTHVWVANTGSNTVSEIQIEDPQVIHFTAPAAGAVGGSAALSATGGASGNPVVFTVDASSGPGVCAVSGTDGATVNYTGAGSCVIDANQAAGNGYAAAAQVQQTITVNQAPAFVVDRPPLTVTAGQEYEYVFAASGTPAPAYALAAGAPSWLSVNGSTGELTGTPPAGTRSFTYTVTAANAAGTATAGPFTVHVAKAPVNADISAALSCPASLKAGAAGTCTLTVANAGPATARKVLAAVVLPAALPEVSCAAGCARHGNVFTWRLASLASGASPEFTITIKATRTGRARVVAIAVSQSPDPRPRNNIAVQTISITR